MARIVLETSRGNRLDIIPHPLGRRLFAKLTGSAPETVELLHVKWSGDALFFVHQLPIVPIPDELTRTLEPGSLAYFPALGEFLLAYGDASPRDRWGTIDVAQVGIVSDSNGLSGLGAQIWRRGMQTARVRVEP